MTWLYLTQRDFERLLSMLRSEDPKVWGEGIGFRRAVIIDYDGQFYYSGPCHIRRTEGMANPSLLWTGRDGQEREVVEAEDWRMEETRKGRRLDLGYLKAFDSLTVEEERVPYRTEEEYR